jgi:DNA invertase Pin-like site-specific DNA recombinase
VSNSIKDRYDVVISYVRFSSAIQELGDSIRRQKSSAKAFCEKNNLVLSDIKYTDSGLSGFKGDNLKTDAGLGSFIDAVRNDPEGHRFPKGRTLLLLDEWSRFSRLPPMKAQSAVNQILDLGIDICTCDTEDILSHDADLPAMLTAIIKMNSAYEESARKSMHLKAVWLNKRKALLDDPINAPKMTSRCPSWLNLDKSKNEYIPIPERVETVKLIYKLYIEGLGRTAIAKYLNTNGIETFGDSVKSARKAKMWRESSVTKIISEKYGRSTLGELQPYSIVDGKRLPTGDAIKDYYPRIISNSDFYQAQDIRQSRITTIGRKGNNLTNLFQGILLCSKCSSSMVIINKGNKGSGTNLVCSRAKVSAGCEYVAWHYGVVEQSILATLVNLDYSILLGATNSDKNIDNINSTSMMLKGQLKENSRLISNIIDAISKMGLNDNLKKRLTTLEEEKLTLESTLKTCKIELASYNKKSHTKLSVWKILDQFINYTRDSTLTDEDIYLKRSKLSMFIKQNIKEIQFTDKLIPMTKELTKQGLGKGSHIRKMFITVALKSGVDLIITGTSKPRYGIQWLASIVADSENNSSSVFTEIENDKVVTKVSQMASSLGNMTYNPEKEAAMGKDEYHASRLDILLNPKKFTVGATN